MACAKNKRNKIFLRKPQKVANEWWYNECYGNNQESFWDSLSNKGRMGYLDYNIYGQYRLA
jgi:hypothetical protein